MSESIPNLEKSLRIAARAVAAPYLGILVLEVGLAAAAFPSVYSSDVNASCGARFLVHYAARNLLTAGIISIVVVLVPEGFKLLRQALSNTSMSEARRQGWLRGAHMALILALGYAALFFFLSVAGQLKLLNDPPKLPPNPTDAAACTAMGDVR